MKIVPTLEELQNLVASYNGTIFLVRGRKSYDACGAKDLLLPAFEGKQVEEFFDFQTNPQYEDIQKGIDLYKKSESNLVLGIGGGSVMDMAKCVSILSTQEGQVEDYITGKKMTERSIPLILIPTTSGTGSEATHFAVAYKDKTKYSVADKSLLPDFTYLDPSLTYSMNEHQTASTGMDALAQAIEGLWSVNSTKESRSYSLEALEKIVPNLIEAVNNPNPKNRKAMLEGSHLAGKSINIAKTTAAHAASYPFTSHFNIAHGHAVSLTLPSYLLFNSQVTEKTVQDERGVDFVLNRIDDVCSALGVADAAEAKRYLENLCVSIGLTHKLTSLGIHESDIDSLVKNGFNPQRVKNNPRKVTEEDLRKILSSLL